MKVLHFILALLFVIAIPALLVWGISLMPESLQGAVITGGGALAAILIAKYQEQRQLTLQQHRAQQLPIYQEFVTFLFQVFKGKDEKGEKWDEDKLNAFLIQFAGKMILHGSDRVIKKYSEFRVAFIQQGLAEGEPDHRPGFKAFGEVLMAIRADLGHSNTGISLADIFVLWINDPDMLLKATPQELKRAAELERQAKDALGKSDA